MLRNLWIPPVFVTQAPPPPAPVAPRMLGKLWIPLLYVGLAVSGVAACALFAAVSGSSPATVIAIGSIMIPAMVKAGYPQRYAIGSMATAGSLGIMIPPSIPLVLYGFVTNESVGKLFI